MTVKKYLIFGFFFIFSANIFAQDPDIDALFNISFQELLNEEFTTATGTSVSLEKAPAVAHVITKEMIEASGATTLDEVLETVPGIHVLPNGYSLLSSHWSIRGIHTNLNPQVLLLIDGAPVKSPMNAAIPLHFRLPVSSISKIEIIKGPGSAIHGADSFAGTINVITKDSEDINGTKTGFRGGSFDTYNLWIEHGKKYGEWDVTYGIEAMKSEGDDDRIVEEDYLHTIGLGVLSDAPGQLQTGYTTIFSYLNLSNENWHIKIFDSYIDDSEMGHGGAQALHKGSHVDFNMISINIAYEKENVFEAFDFELDVTGQYQKNELYYDFFPKRFLNMIGNPRNEAKNGEIELIGFYRGFDSHKIRSSIGFMHMDVEIDQYKNFGPGVSEQFGPKVRITNTPYVFMKDQNKSLWFVTVQDEYEMTENINITTGIRYDEYSDFGGTTNPRIAYVWTPSDKLSNKLLYGKAFRAPSFSEQYFINNPLTIGNPDVEPEEIQTVELVFDYKWAQNFKTNLTIFGYDIEGLIDAVQDPGLTTKTAQNVKDQEGYGFEVEAEWNLSETFQINANAAHQRSYDKDTDEITPNAPENQFYTSFNWNFAYFWFLNTSYTFIGGRHRANGDLRPEIDDYDFVNLTLRKKKVLNNIDFAVSIKNLFDEDRREPSDGAIPNDYPLEGRSVWGEVRYSM